MRLTYLTGRHRSTVWKVLARHGVSRQRRSQPRCARAPPHCELHGAENRHTVSATLRRAADWFTAQGCGPVHAVMSDNANCYASSHQFRDTLTELGARHILIPP